MEKHFEKLFLRIHLISFEKLNRQHKNAEENYGNDKAIGAASLSKTMLFTVIIPKYLNFSHIYTSTATILILIIVVIDGIHIGKIIKPEKPKSVENCKPENDDK